MKWTRRKGKTSKPIIPPGLVKEVGLTFFKDIAEVVHADAIPPELIINIVQFHGINNQYRSDTLPFVLISKYSMNRKEDKNVPIQGTDDYRQITGTFSISMSGNFLRRYNVIHVSIFPRISMLPIMITTGLMKGQAYKSLRKSSFLIS